MASAPRTSPDERLRERLQPRHLDFGAQHVGLGRRPTRVPCVRRADDVPRESDLFGDQRRRPASLLQHQEGVGRLYADVQRRPVRVSAQPVEICQRGCATVAADAGKRDPLLERDTHVRAAQHERQVVERGREHGSSSAETMVGRASPARLRARAACISSRRSPARRMTSPRLRGDGSTGVVVPPPGSARSGPTPRGEERIEDL